MFSKLSELAEQVGYAVQLDFCQLLYYVMQGSEQVYNYLVGNYATAEISDKPFIVAGDSCTCNAVVELRDIWLELLAGRLPRDCRRCCRRTGNNDVSSDVTSSSVRPPLKHDNAPAQQNYIR